MQLLLLAAAESSLAETLRAAGHAVAVVASPGGAELAARRGCVDVAILDCRLELDIAELRRRLPSVPLVAWLHERDDSLTADLLAAGADEVLHPGMGGLEQDARVAALSGRASRPEQAVALGPLSIDRERGEVTWRGRRLALTQRERDVLHALAAEAGATVRRDTLYRSVWGYAMARGDRTVDVNVKRLRDKLAAAVGEPITIETEPGIGYRLVVAEIAVSAL